MTDIAIIGAGPGGLVTALRLHQAGFRPTVYETVPELKPPLGVGVDIKTVGTRELDELGLLEEFRAISVDAEDSIFFNHHGQEIYAEKCGVHMGYLHEQRFVHRGTLQMLLYRAVLDRLGADAVVLGARVAAYAQDEASVTLDLEHRDGRTEQVRHDAVIAADGIKSAVRRQMHPSLAEPEFSGITMWRGTTLREPIRGGHTILHLGDPRISTMIVYPIAEDFEGSGLDLINWVVETNGEETVEDWNQVADPPEQIIPAFDTLQLPFLDVQQLIRDAREVYLFPPSSATSRSTAGSTGGSCSWGGMPRTPCTPRGGNGITQAMLDARVLAEQLVALGDPPREAFAAYDAARREIVNRIADNMRGEGYESSGGSWPSAPTVSRSTTSKRCCRSRRPTRSSRSTTRSSGPPRPGHDAGEATGFRTWQVAGAEAGARHE